MRVLQQVCRFSTTDGAVSAEKPHFSGSPGKSIAYRIKTAYLSGEIYDAKWASHMQVATLKESLTPVFNNYLKHLVAVYLFGSQANGTSNSQSDLDIALLFNTADKKIITELKFALYADFCRALKRNDIDIVILSLSGNLIMNDIVVREGVVIYSADDEQRVNFEVDLLHRCIDFKQQRQLAMGV